MAHTNIILKEVDGIFVPSQSQVSVVKGDSIGFTSDDGQVALFFSPGAVPVLSPAPSVPMVLAPGKKAEFTFTSSDAGAYSVFFEKDASTPPAHFPLRPSNVLLLEIDPSHSGFSGPQNNPRG